MTADAFRLYEVTDKLLTAIGDQQVTAEVRKNGILLRPSAAAWFLANSMIREFTGQGAGPLPVRPVAPVTLDQLFAPTLTISDDGLNFVFRAVNGRLAIVEFKPDDFRPPDDPGDLALLFRNSLV